MREKIKNLKSNLGFTLVELLVVIGVLGILAAGLLATIDPLEQLRKGADSNKKTTTQELVNAVTRYYSTKGAMPWTAGGDSCNGAAAPTGLLVSNFATCLTALENQGEIKTTFKDQTSIIGQLYVTGTDTNVVACYDPESKTESLRPETKYTISGTVNGACPAAGVACYWCAQ